MMVRVKAQRKTHLGATTFQNDQNIINNVAVIFPNFKRRQQKSRVKRVSWRDEQLQNMNVGDIDPAILLVRGKIKYTKEELLEIGKNPASKKKPDFLNPAEVSASILDPEKWNLERKKSDTPETSSKGSDNGDNRRRPGDPRERIRKENDGIVLSPQRRSFNSGCFVPANKEPVRPARPHSPLGKNESTHIMGVRDIQSGTRRIGSGRIMRDSWGDVTDKDVGESDYGFGRGQSRPNEEKFSERRSFGRDIDTGRDKEKDSRRNGRYGDRRKFSECKEDEPEWFSSGPISQNDTIELRGFDEPEKIKKKNAPARVKRNKDFAKKKDTQPIAEEKEKEKATKEKSIKVPEADSTKSSNDQPVSEHKSTVGEEQAQDREEQDKKITSEPQQSDNSFNFEEFLKCDTIPGLLTNGISGDGNKATSRFSQWFNKESPSKEMGGSRRSSIQEDNHIIKDLLKDINESSSVPIAVHPPNDSNAYFAPISPAANTGSSLGNLTGPKPPQAAMGQSINIMDMLVRSKQAPEAWKSAPPIGGKILSLDELEANIRPNVDHSKNQHQKPDEEMTLAFKKLLQQASHPATQNGPMHKTQPMSLLEMLNHSQQQDEARLAAQVAAATQQQQLLSALHGTSQPQFANDLSIKLQQAHMQQKQQMDLLLQQSRELLNRPEAQAILQAMHQRIPSPRELQVHTQNILQRALIKKKLEEQTENFRKKQELQRGTSPSTASGVSQGSSSKGVSSPTPLAFTPTSVLRKMTADKDEGKENKAVSEGGVKPQGRPVTGMRPQTQVAVNNQWNAAFPVKQAGRPIVKANSNNIYHSQTAEQLFAQVQQAQAQQRIYQAVPNQQRKAMVGQQYPPQVSQYGSTSSQYQHINQPAFSQTQTQLTAQQLRAQHQHRPSSNQQKSSQNTGNQSQQQPQSSNTSWQHFINTAAAQQPANRNQQSGSLSPSTSDQLARWFSPDLLERARGGELPSTANLARHAISLEEIERQAAPPVHN
ncbi:eukaryotic translation initiation factor 4E transporter-like isoform X4 [Rhynchophorus ferrugineus]|uniref:eukaryotic translation initiation factor 4E transporter-like isoform X4 n=1 Tax=Rhynchophorus ferrugineus TaxID=354439 RepID=UPI003FCE1835